MNDDDLDEFVKKSQGSQRLSDADDEQKETTSTKRWGKIGSHKWSESKGVVIRTIKPAGMTFCAPPALPGFLFWVDRRNPAKNCFDFEMKLSKEMFDQAITLEEWQETLAKNPPRGTSDEDVRCRAQIDDLAGKLLAALEVLHNHGWRLGLVDPGNLYLILKDDKTVTLILPDLGFSWQGTDNDKPIPWENDGTRPEWLSDTLLHHSRFAEIWAPILPAYQQFAHTEGWKDIPIFAKCRADTTSKATPLLVRQADFCLVARLFGFLLDGRISFDSSKVRDRPAVWGTLAAAFSAEGYTSAQRFLDFLELNSLSSHFRPVAPPRERTTQGNGVRMAVFASLVLLCAGLVGIGVLYLNQPEDDANKVKGHKKNDDKKITPVAADEDKHSPDFIKLVEKLKQTQTVGDRIDVLSEMAGLANPTKKDSQTTREFIKEIRTEWKAEFHKVYERGKDPVHEIEVARAAKKLHTGLMRLQKLDPKEEDVRWLSECTQLFLQSPPP